MLTVTATAPAGLDAGARFLVIGLLLLLLITISLLVWSLFGVGLGRLTGNGRSRRWIDRGLGATLILAAATLLLGVAR